jgi:hypothetical protein
MYHYGGPYVCGESERGHERRAGYLRVARRTIPARTSVPMSADAPAIAMPR